MHIELKEERPCVFMSYYYYWLLQIVIVLIPSFFDLSFKANTFETLFSTSQNICLLSIAQSFPHDSQSKRPQNLVQGKMH